MFVLEERLAGVVITVVFFFFSSRRRHTRLQGDWSSDVCSSDLTVGCTHFAAPCAVRPFPNAPHRFSSCRNFFHPTRLPELPLLREELWVEYWRLRPSPPFRLSLAFRRPPALVP